MTYAPLIRIMLRYLVGAAIIGSDKIGDQLAADPDLVMVLAGATAVLVEGFYAWAKRNNWST